MCIRDSHYLYTHRDRRAVEQLEQDGLWSLFSDGVTSEDGFPPVSYTHLDVYKRQVFNSADAILACDDKALTWLRLRRAGIPMPRTLLAPKTFSTVGYPQTGFRCV